MRGIRPFRALRCLAGAVTQAWLFLCLPLVLSAAHGAGLPACSQPYPPLSPKEFVSRDAAEAFVKHAFAGGDVSIGEAEGQAVMFVSVQGSGVPSIYVAAYAESGTAWVRTAEVAAVPPLTQWVSILGNAVVVYSGKEPQCVMMVVQPVDPPAPGKQARKPCEAIAHAKAWQSLHDDVEHLRFGYLSPGSDGSAVRNEIMALKRDAVLASIRTQSDFEPLFVARYWMAGEFGNTRTMIPALIALLTDRTRVGLTNAGDIIIPERIGSGELKSYGHGWYIEDDLFLVSGRASWLLKEITGEKRFGTVKPDSSALDVEAMQRRWANWYALHDCTGSPAAH